MHSYNKYNDNETMQCAFCEEYVCDHEGTNILKQCACNIGWLQRKPPSHAYILMMTKGF